MVVAPMNDATFCETPRRSSSRQVLRQRRPGDVVLDVALCSACALLHLVVERAHRAPSPKICVVTPWRISPCDRPSTSSDSVDHDSMLMKPGATARPVASITLAADAAREVADRRHPVAADPTSALTAGAAGPVVDRAAADDDVERRRTRGLGIWRSHAAGSRRERESERRQREESGRTCGTHPRIIVYFRRRFSWVREWEIQSAPTRA